MEGWKVIATASSLVILVLLFGIWMIDIEKSQEDIDRMKLEVESIRIEQETVEYLLDLVEEYQIEITRLRELLDAFKIDTFEATAYTHVKTAGVADINGTGDGITASGKRVKEGLIAVDPSVIPLGTKVWVDGFGILTAADTGGAIKGNKIDIFMESRKEAFKFGRQYVEVVYKLGG